MMFGMQQDTPSTRPYLIRALHEWCTDNGFSPYLAVQVDASVQVPAEFVNNGEIVLNVSFDATSGLRMGNDFIEFKARFGGVARDIMVPIDHVVAIYARENGQGMAFPPPSPEMLARPESMPQALSDMKPERDVAESDHGPLRAVPNEPAPHDGGEADPPPAPPRPDGRPHLKRVK
jgi:stringent starvation protein B